MAPTIAPPGERLRPQDVHRLFERVVRRLLGRMFEQRHRIVQDRLAHQALVHA